MIANHDSGWVVWVARRHNHNVLQGFFDALSPQRCAQVEAISMDMAKVWQQLCADNIPKPPCGGTPVPPAVRSGLDVVSAPPGQRFCVGFGTSAGSLSAAPLDVSARCRLSDEGHQMARPTS